MNFVRAFCAGVFLGLIGFGVSNALVVMIITVALESPELFGFFALVFGSGFIAFGRKNDR